MFFYIKLKFHLIRYFTQLVDALAKSAHQEHNIQTDVGQEIIFG